MVESKVIGGYLVGSDEGTGVLGIGTTTSISKMEPMVQEDQKSLKNGRSNKAERSGRVFSKVLVILSDPGDLLER